MQVAVYMLKSSWLQIDQKKQKQTKTSLTNKVEKVINAKYRLGI